MAVPQETASHHVKIHQSPSFLHVIEKCRLSSSSVLLGSESIGRGAFKNSGMDLSYAFAILTFLCVLFTCQMIIYM